VNKITSGQSIKAIDYDICNTCGIIITRVV